MRMRYIPKMYYLLYILVYNQMKILFYLRMIMNKSVKITNNQKIISGGYLWRVSPEDCFQLTDIIFPIKMVRLIVVETK